VHETPEVRDHHGLLFPTFSAGVEAMQRCVRAGCGPSLFRLSDAMETELSMHMKPPSQGFKAILHRAMKRVLAARGYTRPCLMIAGFEGPATRVPRWRRAAFKILKRSGGIHLGQRIGRAWSKEKYNLPYLRDVVMDRGVAVDVAETAAPWSRVLPLYDATIAAMSEAFSAHGRPGYLGCHVSHTYATGACLYFTWAVRPDPGQEIVQYNGYKRLVTNTFLAQGGALSHHHAIGIEHRPWMREELGPTGIRALRGLKTTLDPDGIMNPGKLIPDP
jgi:alkyldihydroxyacetonephosphate synthase